MTFTYLRDLLNCHLISDRDPYPHIATNMTSKSKKLYIRVRILYLEITLEVTYDL